jgi:hypothetical protein
MRTLRHVGTGLLALTLFTGLAACGDDEPEDGAEAFCDAVVEFNTASADVQLDEASTEADITAAGEQLAPLSESVAADAPEEVAADADEVDAAVQDLAEGDAAAFNDEATFERYTALLAGAVEACEFEIVDVTAVDYAYEGVPASIDAGTVAFALANEGEEQHEMLVFRKVDGISDTFADIFAGSEEDSEGKIEFTAAAFAPPGGESSSLAELTPGDYAMVCFIPVGGGEDGPPHVTEGMVQEFTVE